MPRRFLSDDARRALGDAVRAIEAQSRAEVVVAIRARSGSYVATDLAFGVAVGWLTLAVLLFSPWEFAWEWILLDPLLFGALAGLGSSRLALLRRALTPASVRRRRVAEAAKAAFWDKGVGGTSGRTGMLCYVSVLEREVEILADAGITAHVDGEAWAAAVATVRRAIAEGGDGRALAEALGALAAPLARLGRDADDVNELPDEVVAG